MQTSFSGAFLSHSVAISAILLGWGRAKPRPVQAELFGSLWLQSFVPQALQAFDFEYFDYFVAKRDKAQSKKKLAVKKDTDTEKIDVIDV